MNVMDILVKRNIVLFRVISKWRVSCNLMSWYVLKWNQVKKLFVSNHFINIFKQFLQYVAERIPPSHSHYV